jgi:hypothetical protein
MHIWQDFTVNQNFGLVFNIMSVTLRLVLKFVYSFWVKFLFSVSYKTRNLLIINNIVLKTCLNL